MIPESGPNVEAERAGIRWVLQWAIDAGYHRAAIVAPGVREIEPLQRALGPRVADMLRRDRQIKADSGLILEILLAGKLPMRYGGPVFVPWAHDPLIDKVEEMRPPAICAQPWAPNDLSVWRRSWPLADARTGAQVTRPVQLSDVVTAALEDLTHRVNLGTGIGHPSDKASAVDLLKALHHGGEILDGDGIRAWAVGHGWEPRHAQRLGTLADKIAKGVAVRGGRRPSKTEMNRQLARWREPEAA